MNAQGYSEPKAQQKSEPKESWDKFWFSLPYKKHNSPVLQICFTRKVAIMVETRNFIHLHNRLHFYVHFLASMNYACLKQLFIIIILFGLGCKPVIISSSSFNVIPISLVGSEWTSDTNDTKSCLLQTNQGREFSSGLLLLNFAKYFRCSLYAGLYIK